MHQLFHFHLYFIFDSPKNSQEKLNLKRNNNMEKITNLNKWTPLNIIGKEYRKMRLPFSAQKN